jgi:photosystem II stability/assembly factor-like uncharacterized protein
MLRAVVAFGLALTAAAAPPEASHLLLDAARSGEALVVVGERGAILRSSDEGDTWTVSPAPVLATLTAVAFDDDAVGWAVGHDGVILHSANGGRTWAVQHAETDREASFLDICAVDARHAIAVGAYGLFLATSDGGASWTPRRISEDDFHFNRIVRTAAGVLFIAGEAGTLLRSTDAGENWEPVSADYEGSFFGLLPLADGSLIAHGLRGRLFRSVDDGAEWQDISTEQTGLLATAVQLRSGAVVVAGQARTFLVSTGTDGGRAFSPWSPPHTTAVAELLELKTGGLLLVGESGVTRLSAP